MKMSSVKSLSFLLAFFALSHHLRGIDSFELSCQPPTRFIRLLHLQDVSTSMTGYIQNGLLGGAVSGFDDWLRMTFNSGTTTGIMTFTNKKYVGTSDDVCADTNRDLHDSPIIADYSSLVYPLGSGDSLSSLHDVLYRTANYNWDSPSDSGRRVAIVYTDKLPQTPPTPGMAPFDESFMCESVDYPTLPTVVDELAAAGIYLIFVVSPDLVDTYKSMFGTEAVVTLTTDPLSLEENLFYGVDYIYCGTPIPTINPEGSTPQIITLPTTEPTSCTEDAILQMLLVQDISWSYTNDLASIKAGFPTLLQQLEDKFHTFEMGLVSHSDKPYEPFGYSYDYCYREDQSFTTSKATFLSALDSLDIMSGRDWKESQYDAVYDGLVSATLGWEGSDVVDGRQVLRVVVVATDAGPHVYGDKDDFPANHPQGCEFRDYVAPAVLGAQLGNQGTYPIFVVTNDIKNHWIGLAADITSTATVIPISDIPEVFDAISDALDEICDANLARIGARKSHIHFG